MAESLTSEQCMSVKQIKKSETSKKKRKSDVLEMEIENVRFIFVVIVLHC